MHGKIFTLIDYNGRGIREMIDNLYQLINTDVEDRLSLQEFYDVIDIMKTGERLYSNSNKYWESFRELCNQTFYFEKIGRSIYWNSFILFIVMVNTIMVLVFSVFSNSDNSLIDDILTNIDLIFNLIYFVDVIIKIVGFGINDYFSDSWNNFDFGMVVVSVITIIGINYIYFLKKVKSTKLVKLAKLQRVLKIFRSIRSLKLIKFFKLGTDALIRV